MPSGWLSVPAHKQSRPGRCLPVCAQMVLAYLGDERSEEELARLTQTRTFGVRASNIRLLEKIGYAVAFGETTFSQLKEYLREGIPPIIFLQTDALPYWDESVNHAVVLIDIADDDQVTLIDPAFGSAYTVARDDFLLAWSDFDYTFAVISKRLDSIAT